MSFFMLSGGKAALAPRFSPLVKALVRRKSGAAQKGRWVVFLRTRLKLKISILTVPSKKKRQTLAGVSLNVYHKSQVLVPTNLVYATAPC